MSCTRVPRNQAAVAASDPPLPAVWISLYYVAFYVVMTGIFALCIYVLMCTVDPYTPDYQDQLKSPGTGRRALLCPGLPGRDTAPQGGCRGGQSPGDQEGGRGALGARVVSPAPRLLSCGGLASQAAN